MILPVALKSGVKIAHMRLKRKGSYNLEKGRPATSKCLVKKREKDKLHYWKTVLCRVSETLPSVFYRGTRQNKALDKGGFAECQTLGKAGLSAKLGFAAALGKDPTRQKVAGP